eukprot:5213849-Alexandrium_andersonii.AAC.1
MGAPPVVPWAVSALVVRSERPFLAMRVLQAKEGRREYAPPDAHFEFIVSISVEPNALCSACTQEFAARPAGVWLKPR